MSYAYGFFLEERADTHLPSKIPGLRIGASERELNIPHSSRASGIFRVSLTERKQVECQRKNRELIYQAKY